MPHRMQNHRWLPEEAAQRFVDARFAEASVAILAGSPVRGDPTPTSDLDLVIVTSRPEAPYRESFVDFSWLIEAFVHTAKSLQEFFASDARRRRPSRPRMCAEGIAIRDRDGLAAGIQAEAAAILQRGPEPFSRTELEDVRYRITDLLDDLVGSQSRDETVFIANDLAVAATELLLVTNGRWVGRGKWVVRTLREYDPHRSEELMRAMHDACSEGARDRLVTYAESV